MRNASLSLAFAFLLAGALGCSLFDLGVGAFEIGTDRVILWTHVEPPEGAGSVTLTLRVATDADFANVVAVQAVSAEAADDFTVRALVTGLQPATPYYYRFVGAGAGGLPSASPVGRFRTAPLPTDGAPVRFVVSGDSNLGYTKPLGLDFHVLTAAAWEDPDFFVYFGDTIYADTGALPGGASAFTLDEYRTVHRLTRMDPHLQTLLAATGTFSGWDDHEVRNDYDGETVNPVQFENGARAFFEYLPVREAGGGAPYRTDRSVRWGEHVELFLIDGRQFRSAERFCNPDPTPDGPETGSTLFSPFVEDGAIATMIRPLIGPLVVSQVLEPSDPDCVADELQDPGRTMLGAEQLASLKAALLASTATFKIIVNDVPLSTLYVTPYDRWDGYGAEKQDLLDFIAEELDPSHVLVITTDFHTNMAIQRPELTEVIVGPIGQATFATTTGGLFFLAGIPPIFLPALLGVFDDVVGVANGAVLASIHDAFSYGVVDVWEDGGGMPRLRFTARGNLQYARGANEPRDVSNLFSVELP